MKQLEIGLEDLKPIKRLYNKAVKAGETEFTYKENVLVVGYIFIYAVFLLHLIFFKTVL